MKHDFLAAMRRATQATRAFNLAEATSIIQDAVSPDRPTAGARQRELPGSFAIPENATGGPDESAEAPSRAPSIRVLRPLGEVVRRLREGRLALRTRLPGLGRGATPALPIPEGAQFQFRSFTCAAGTRSYRLYVPASSGEGLRGLLVMLHGCTQTPEDFAAGTAMNVHSETHRLLVAYPAQSATENAMSCWNWFRPGDQRRAAGEPAIIAGLTESIIAEFGIPRDGDSVFVAGLSAGGAMAAVMGATYPELYAAVGVHSGLAHGAASDVLSAFAAMRGETNPALRPMPPPSPDTAPRVIVFHGTADTTVHPTNAERIVATARRRSPTGALRSERGVTTDGRSYERTVAARPDGMPGVECWMIQGGGHAWSGGHPSGSYTEPHGPDASAEMVRFFLGASGKSADREP